MNAETSSHAINAAFDAMKRRVLCVDGNDRFLDAVCHFLATCGHEATPAASGRDAMDIVRRGVGRFDAILIEDSIADLGGIQVVGALRDCGFQGRILIKASKLLPAQREAYQARGVYAVVDTPVELDKLLRLIQAPAGETPPSTAPM